MTDAGPAITTPETLSTDDIARFTRDGRPDWTAISFEIRCSRCDYDLRMLDLPRCPECGLTFDWPTLIRERFFKSPFLFEHRWRQRPILSWLDTVFRSFNPVRFWRSISIHEQIRVRPLGFMALSSVPLFLIVLHATAFLLAEFLRWLVPGTPTGPGAVFTAAPTPVQMFILECEGLAMLPYHIGIHYALVPLAPLVMLFSAVGLLSILRETLGRCRVRTAQVFRVFAYASPAAAVATALMFFVLWGLANLFRGPGISAWIYIVPFIFMFGISLPLGILLSIGLQHYLRLPRPWALGLVAAFTGVLTTAVGAVLLQGVS